MLAGGARDPREVGNRRTEGVVLGNLGGLLQKEGQMEEALRHYQEALAISREVGDRRSEGLVLGNLGALHARQGRLDSRKRVRYWPREKHSCAP